MKFSKMDLEIYKFITKMIVLILDVFQPIINFLLELVYLILVNISLYLEFKK